MRLVETGQTWSKRSLALLFAIALSPGIHPAAVVANQTIPLLNEREYTENFNKYLEARRLSDIDSGKKQGRVEIAILFLLLAVVLAPLIASVIKRGTTSTKLLAVLASFPNIVNLSLFLVLNSIGEWGSFKHPSIHRLAENYQGLLPAAFILTILISLIVYFAIIGYDYKQTRSVRTSIKIHVTVYVLTTTVFFVYAFLLSKLP